jgi:hypothetical protein
MKLRYINGNITKILRISYFVCNIFVTKNYTFCNNALLFLPYEKNDRKTV